MEEKTKYRKALDELLDDVDVRFSLTLNHLADEFGSQILRILAERKEHPPCISEDHHKILIRMFITICDETIHKRPDKEPEAWFWKGLCQLWLEDSDAPNSLNKADEFFQAEREWREEA